MVFSVIGTGNMGRALVGGFIKSGMLIPKDVRLCDIDEKKVTELASETGCQTAGFRSDSPFDFREH